MIEAVVYGCLVALGLALLAGIWRVARGPTVIDRMLAFDLVAVTVVGTIGLLTVLWETPMFLELILVYSLLGFLSTVALAYYLNKTIAVRRPRRDERKPSEEANHE
jgi:multisubunit Na+/H+ antiporter MnhF subunit